MADWKSKTVIGLSAVGCLVLAVVIFIALGVIGLLWFGVQQLF